jgi:large-conductance mechanosensitive channel
MAPKERTSTVRQRKKSALTSTQRYLPISEVRADTVLLKNGGLRAVIEVEALNFNLKSETEQQGIISGYESFVNTILFPIQVLVRSSKMNIDPYLVQLRAIADKQTNPLLKEQTVAYANFVEKLVDIADIMQKRFYVVVPVDMSPRKKSVLEQFFNWISPDDNISKAFARNREFLAGNKELRERVTLVQTGLENIGLQSKRMSTHELVQLYYGIYNPRTSEEQKLPPEESLRTDHSTL